MPISIDQTFATAINCMDGRVQEPVNQWIKEHYDIQYVDCVTAPGANKVLIDGNEGDVERLKQMIEVSVNAHRSKVIIVAGHDDCAGHPCTSDVQKETTERALERLRTWYPQLTLVSLHVSEEGQVTQLSVSESRSA
ncbi:hypothetical protein G4V62_10505 [Bacillaceae bacterium SIJ1]|uniref:carbonic anhydrase n=1 Tax=Litoribacterium kuwaitense TaxID=1398745 RepID=UPI0013EE071B|nr:carbonic anhydrase [Litoribacterium kuwaitense]NGP45362.1 hypothetical protein [Litoribacterium kuwaitense]